MTKTLVQIESGPLTPIKYGPFFFLVPIAVRLFLSAQRKWTTYMEGSFWTKGRAWTHSFLLASFASNDCSFLFPCHLNLFAMLTFFVCLQQVKYCSINYLGWWLGAGANLRALYRSFGHFNQPFVRPPAHPFHANVCMHKVFYVNFFSCPNWNLCGPNTYRERAGVWVWAEEKNASETILTRWYGISKRSRVLKHTLWRHE